MVNVNHFFINKKKWLAATYSPGDFRTPVPSAFASLTAVFGMGTGVSSQVSPPAKNILSILQVSLVDQQNKERKLSLEIVRTSTINQ